MGIYVGPESITPAPAKEVYVGTELVWPTGPTYSEAFYWFDADTPGRQTWTNANGSGGMWYWVFDRPEWATEVDMVMVRTGGRGFDGSRGFGNNDGNGGRAWRMISVSEGLQVAETGCQARIGVPGSTGGSQADRSPHPSQFVWQTHSGGGALAMPSDNDTSGMITPSNPTGASVPPRTLFGRTWPGGTGGARDQPGQPYGGGGGGGQGAPRVGGDRRNGQNGAPGYLALRFRSGPVPDGHVWPQNPDWTNPQ